MYPPGTRILLLGMDDPHHPVPPGTRGTVDHVDDGGNIHMKWDNGRTLSLCSDADSFRTLTAAELAEEQAQQENPTEDEGQDEGEAPVMSISQQLVWGVKPGEVADFCQDHGSHAEPQPRDSGNILFYAGYLSTENARGYLPNVVTSTLKAIVDSSDTRQNRMMFKLAVEIAIVQNLIAATQDIDPVSLERLRGECVKEVKRLNGGFSFEDALAWQKG